MHVTRRRVAGDVLGRGDADAEHEALERVRRACRDGDVGHVVVRVTGGDRARQRERFVGLRVRRASIHGDVHLAPPLADLKDQRDLTPDGDVAQREGPVDGGARVGERAALEQSSARARVVAGGDPLRKWLERHRRYVDRDVVEGVLLRGVVHLAGDRRRPAARARDVALQAARTNDAAVGKHAPAAAAATPPAAPDTEAAAPAPVVVAAAAAAAAATEAAAARPPTPARSVGLEAALAAAPTTRRHHECAC